MNKPYAITLEQPNIYLRREGSLVVLKIVLRPLINDGWPIFSNEQTCDSAYLSG